VRPAVKKKPAPKQTSVDARKELVKLRKWVREALTEVKLARSYMQNEWTGPQHEALDWAQQLLENALRGKAVPK
jgi:hypothetical protein